MAIYLATKQDVCRFYKEDFWGELRIRKNVYARINKFLFGRKKRKFDNSTRFDVIKLDNKRFKRRKRLTKEQIRFIQKEKIKHYFLNLSEYGLRSILLRTKTAKVSRGQNYKDKTLRDAFTTRLDHLIFSFGWATSLGHARVLIKKGVIQVNKFIPTRIDFIPMAGDEIQIRPIYKSTIRRKLISLRQRRLKTAFRLSRRRLAYYLLNMNDRNWKKLRPKLYYKKFKLFRNPAVRKLRFKSVHRFHKFYKGRLTRHSTLINWFHPKNYHHFKKRLRYPFRYHGKFYTKFYKNKLRRLRDYEYVQGKQRKRIKFTWIRKLRNVGPANLRYFLKHQAYYKPKNVKAKSYKPPYDRDGRNAYYFNKSKNKFFPTNRERLHSHHARHKWYPDSKPRYEKFKHRKRRRKFNKFRSNQTVFESDLFFADRTAYFSIINDKRKRAELRVLELKQLGVLREKIEEDRLFSPSFIFVLRDLSVVHGDEKFIEELLEIQKTTPRYWTNLFKTYRSQVDIDRTALAQHFNFEEARAYKLQEFVSPYPLQVFYDTKILAIKHLRYFKAKTAISGFVNYLQYQQLGLNRVVNLLNFKPGKLSHFFYYNFGPTNVNSLYNFSCDLLNWPLFTSVGRFRRLRQLIFNTWRSPILNAYKLLKANIEHYYSYFSFFYAKRNFLTVQKKGALHYFLRFLHHLNSQTTNRNRLLAFQFPGQVKPRKLNSHYLSISKARLLARDRVKPTIVSDYTISLLIARSKTIRGTLSPQFKVLAQNIIHLNKILIKTFIQNSSKIIPLSWLQQNKLKKKNKKITAKFLIKLLIRLSKKLGIPIFNRPIYNLKLGIRGRAKHLLTKQATIIENTKFPQYVRFYHLSKMKRFNRKLRRLKRKALRIRYRTLIARRFPNFIINYKLLLAIYLGPKRIFTTKRFKKRTRKVKKWLKRTLRFRRRKNRFFRVNKRKKRRFFYYFPFKFNLKTVLTYYGNGKRTEKLNRENDVYITYPHLPYNTRF